MSIPEFTDIVPTNDQTEARAKHLEEIRELVGNAYPNAFHRYRNLAEKKSSTNVCGEFSLD